MNYKYENGENPEERIRNKLSVVFIAVEAVHQGHEVKNIIERAMNVIPEIIEHLDDIEEFYKQKTNNEEQN